MINNVAEILFDQVPSLDLAAFSSGDTDQKRKFVSDLGEAFSNIGFVAIKNHDLTNELTDKLYDTVKAFFALPDPIKANYEIEEPCAVDERQQPLYI